MKSRVPLFSAIMLSGFLWVASAGAAGFELKPYGFVKGEMTYASSGVLSSGKVGLGAPQMADTLNGHAFGVSCQTTRFGMRGWTTTDNNIEIGGKVEADFASGSGIDAGAKPRLRLAYAWVANPLADIRIGQQWDLFSSLNPTMSTGASGLWYSGNLGTRRGQFQVNFYVPENTLAPIVSVAICEAAKEADGLGADNFSSFPMVQARGSMEYKKKYSLGVAMVQANFDPNPAVADNEYATFGYGLDFDLRFHKLFAIRGEVNTGQNLANANFSTIAGAGKKTDTRRNSGLWANIMSKPFKHFNWSVGGGLDRNQSDRIAAAAPLSNTIFYNEFIVPIMAGFSLEAEVGQIHTRYKDRESRSATFTNLAGKLEF